MQTVACHRRAVEKGNAARRLGAVDEEYVLAGMAADCADEALSILRHFGAEHHDLADTRLRVNSFMSRLH